MSNAQVLPAPREIDSLDIAPVEEEQDDFEAATSDRPLFDLSALAPPRRIQRASTASVATTADLASDVGSVVMEAREAFLKSFTFHQGEQEINWGIAFGEPMQRKKMLLTKSRLPIVNVEEDSIFSLSRIRPGDYLKSINGKSVGPSYNGKRALARMKTALKNDGYLTVVTKNKEEGTDDILVHCTIVKPEPGMSLKELGMTVWVWGYLCIKSLEPNSIFKESALRSGDNIVSVNEIVCEDVKPEQFANIVKALPREVTITVLRRKQRGNGDFK